MLRRVSYNDLESRALMAGINPQMARFRQLGQVQAGVFVPTLGLPEPEGDPGFDPNEEFGTGTGTRHPRGPHRARCQCARTAGTSKANRSRRTGSHRVSTFVGLAVTYLGGVGARWREIWDVQSDSFRSKHPSPDLIFAEEIIRMPNEATENMLAFLALGEPSGQTPGELTPGQKTKSKLRKALPWILGGAGALGGGYLLYRASK